MSDTEQGCCDFCGDATIVAVSEQVRGRVTICESCAAWAAAEIRDIVRTTTPAQRKKLTPTRTTAPERKSE